MYKNWRREYEETEQEPDEYEVDSDTEEVEEPISPPTDEEGRKRPSSLMKMDGQRVLNIIIMMTSPYLMILLPLAGHVPHPSLSSNYSSQTP